MYYSHLVELKKIVIMNYNNHTFLGKNSFVKCGTFYFFNGQENLQWSLICWKDSSTGLIRLLCSFTNIDDEYILFPRFAMEGREGGIPKDPST